MSPLADLIASLIESDGPISLETYMALSNGHPTLGYYATRDPLGADGDFTTAPEISQMFGELVGLWASEAWHTIGAPDPVRLVELGPGRGTMMADALRALRVAPEFLAALDVHLVEASPVLTERQRQALKAVSRPITWHTTLESVPDGPAIILANEFFDALPVRHFVRQNGTWRERLVGIASDGGLQWGVATQPEDALRVDAAEGAVIEIGAVSQRVMAALARRIVADGGALLVVDYGYTETRVGETLQALQRHRSVDPLASAGTADLTAHVDFAALARAAKAEGADVRGPVTQAFFLEQIGIRQRASALAKRAPPDGARAIGAALRRLTATASATSMGSLFKAMAVVRPDTPALAGFIELDV